MQAGRHRGRDLDGEAGAGLHLVDDAVVRRVVHGNDQHVVLSSDRNDEVLRGIRFVDERGESPVELDLVEIDGADVELETERAADGFLGHVLEVHERLAEAPAGATSFIEGAVELLLGDGPDPHENFAQGQPFAVA